MVTELRVGLTRDAGRSAWR